MVEAGQTIRQQVERVAKLFEALVVLCPSVDDSRKAGHVIAEDELGRFRIWAGNIGVSAKGHASLDYRLRDSQEARELMFELLNTLESHINRAIDINEVDDNTNPSILSGIGKYESSYDAHSGLHSSTISSAFNGTETESLMNLMSLSPFDNQMRGIEQSIDRLYRLSVAIRRASLLNQDRMVAKFIMKDEEGNENETEFKAYALKRATMELPQASPAILQRMSQAITYRRRRFLYRSRHQTKLGVQLFNSPTRTGAISTNRGSTAAGTVTTALPISNSLNRNLSAQRERLKGFNSQASATTATEFRQSQPLNATILETPSVVSTNFQTTIHQHYNLPIPDAPPVNSGSKEFECPYCCLILPIEEAEGHKWRRHVMNDLEPYVCLFDDCADSHALYRDQRSWLAHIQKNHSRQWTCTSTGHTLLILSSEEEYEDHMNSVHSGAFTKDQLPWLKMQSQGPSEVIFDLCPFCGYSPSDADLQKEAPLQGLGLKNKYDRARITSSCVAKHITFHLESISLISLPWQESFQQIDESDRSASSKVEKDSQESEGEDTELEFDECENNSLREKTLNEWLEETSPYEELSSSLGPYFESEWGFLDSAEYFGHARDPILQTFLRKWYLDAAPESFEGNKIQLPACITPHHSAPNFFGREHELKAIELALLQTELPYISDVKPITNPRTFAIHAPGGMGKTQVAMQFIARHRDMYDAVFWVHADDQTKLSQDFNNIAIKLGIVAQDSPDSRDLVYTRRIVRKWLINPVKDLKDISNEKADKATWLLVFDGVEDPAMLNDYWPYDGPGSVLITSRNPFSWRYSIQLRPFTMDESTRFLMTLAGEKVSNEERQAMIEVSNRLGGLPLALAQMAGTIQHKKLSFVEFLKSYDQWYARGEFLRLTRNDTAASSNDYEHTLASVWAFDNLARGSEMLNIASMLDPDGIHQNVFTAPLRNTELDIFPKSWVEFSAAKHELVACSLLSRNKTENKFFIHRLVQDVARARMTPSEYRKYFMICVKLISSLWPFEQFDWRHGIDRWTTCEELFPHIAQLKDLFVDDVKTESFSNDTYQFARLLTDAGWYHHERGRSSEADDFNNCAEQICETLKKQLDEFPPSTAEATILRMQVDANLAEIQHNRGCIATEINEPENALRYSKRFHDMMIEELANRSGGHDMRLAISWNELGIAHMLINEWKNAQKCFEKSILLMKQLDSFKEILLTLPLVNLGLAHWIQGRNDEAEKVLSKGLQDREDAFGPDDRISFITGRFLHALGNVKADQGLMEDSQSYHHRALLHYKSTLGNNHHRTADTLVKVAEHHLRQGQGEIALALLEHSLKIYSSSTNNTYTPEKARASFKRSQALRILGRMEAADEELQRCFVTYRTLTGPGSAAQRLAKSTSSDGVMLERKNSPHALQDQDLNDLITFWSK